ncbi:lim homeobox protein [Culex quinquefasciatus]|uniref:Lim homeobox protein n=1 Tax=Culex quinquefasciatus TaxID=7176 RepID=B0WSA8_CULQU|nr:lim homeobox protein [Culex quinquefasciatus]|eukprot:XP_001870661.1 lim homeobox protein [Culex quinquefasciatus]
MSNRHPNRPFDLDPPIHRDNITDQPKPPSLAIINLSAALKLQAQPKQKENIEVEVSVGFQWSRDKMLKDLIAAETVTPEKCAGCGIPIRDRYYLLVADRAWHNQCLRCCKCLANLETELSCYAREGNIYCKDDYYRASHLKIHASSHAWFVRNCFRYSNTQDIPLDMQHQHFQPENKFRCAFAVGKVRR